MYFFQTVDDLIVALMSMGFELDDCHDAIQQGKVTVETAVEWLIAGKPGFVKGSNISTPSLKLNPNRSVTAEPVLAGASHNPFAAPIPVLPVPSSDAGTGEQSQSEKSDVVSRLHMNDGQRKFRKDYDEKCRQAAQKRAREEKINAKKEHERILKDIAEDRDKQKMMRVNPPRGETSSTSSAPQQSQLDSSSPQKPAGDKCLLQIRLPDGRCLRESFAPDATLNSVWDFVYAKFKGTSQMCFMQPFPRREFTRDDFSSTLQQLGLSPSGSLVLKKPQENQAMESVQMQDEQAENDENEDTERMDTDGFEQRINQRFGPRQQWGRGHRLDAAAVENTEEDMEGAEDEDSDEDAGQFGGMNRGLMEVMGNQFPPMRGLNAGMAWGEDPNGQVFQGVGQVLVPEGHPGDERRHQNRTAAEMAAEAARGRFAVPDVAQAPEPAADESCSHLMYHPTSLLQLCLHHVSCRLSNPRNPYVSLGGIAEDLAQKLISQLLKDRALKPKILQLFVPCYLTKLLLDCYPYATNDLLNTVKYHVHLKNLSLNSCSLITDNGLKAITGLKKLKVLNLGSCKQLTNKCLTVISELPNLQGLNLEDTGVTDSGIIDFLSTCTKHLQNLNLNRTQVTHSIIPHLHVLPSLKSLYLEQTKIHSLSGIENLKQLEVLDVAQTTIVTESLLCLQHHPALTCLSIANNENIVGDLALQYISGLKLHTLYLPSRHSTTSRGLSHLVNMKLTALDLTNFIHINDNGLQHIGKITSLTTLLLSNTKLTDEGMFYLEGLTNLQVLYLDRTMVSDVGVQVFKHFTKLEELSLASTSVTSHFLMTGILNSCQMLSKLNLSRTNISDKGIINLKLKNLTLLNLDYTRVHPHLIENLNERCPMIRTVTYAKLAPLAEEDED
ncbi:uncharacterized protein LOC121380593 [Gigantopelta aegis]|uniref:uncharacterized protein LOC121380593 n=1 Tax=Gigantopelta aegis TaxID=1735272 RepID=UPI001B88751E|nr:uncharacterized protein LOC121380593 [Gigantopelta aegis]